MRRREAQRDAAVRVAKAEQALEAARRDAGTAPTTYLAVLQAALAPARPRAEGSGKRAPGSTANAGPAAATGVVAVSVLEGKAGAGVASDPATAVVDPSHDEAIRAHYGEAVAAYAQTLADAGLPRVGAPEALAAFSPLARRYSFTG